MTHFLSWLPAWGLGHGHGLGLEAIAWAMAKPGLRPKHKPDCQKANGHKLGAMAQDIRYPGVRVGEACGPGVAS